jgi:diguanylate cyclase
MILAPFVNYNMGAKIPVSAEAAQFYGVLILAFLGVILLYTRERTQSVRRANQELEKRVAERTDALQFAQKRLYDVNSELETQLREVNTLQVKLKEQAIRDSLTGLYNRRHLNDVIHKELARARRQGHSVVFLLLDLDHFKQINDTYGHTGGDQALVVLGKLLEKHTRSSDYAFRYCGEEFMVMLTGIGLDDAKKRAEDLRMGVENMKVKYEGLSVPLTTSIGVASYPDHGQTIEEMLVAVDDALYKAKFKGRNRVVISGED